MCFDPNQTSDAFFRASGSYGSYLRVGWGDSISGRNVDREGTVMNQLETDEASEAAHGNSGLQKELAEVLRQRAAISAVLRAIANSPHDLQPIFDTIIDSAVHLCRAEGGAFRLSEGTGFRLAASKLGPAMKMSLAPMLRGGSIISGLSERKLPVHIPDLATNEEYY